jgi:hypothetical protein
MKHHPVVAEADRRRNLPGPLGFVRLPAAEGYLALADLDVPRVLRFAKKRLGLLHGYPPNSALNSALSLKYRDESALKAIGCDKTHDKVKNLVDITEKGPEIRVGPER